MRGGEKVLRYHRPHDGELHLSGYLGGGKKMESGRFYTDGLVREVGGRGMVEGIIGYKKGGCGSYC